MPEGMTQQDREWHKKYVRLPMLVKEAVNDAYRSCRSELHDSELKTANDDRAEALVAAIARFVLESNPDVQLEPDPDDGNFILTPAKPDNPGYIDVIFTSVWDGDTAFQSKAQFFPASGEIYITETYDTDSHNDLNALTREYITLPNGDEMEVCTTCHEYVMRPAMVSGVGKALGETTQCSDPNCPSHDDGTIQFDEDGNTYSG